MLRDETTKLDDLEVKPASYRFVTSRRLTRENKRALKDDLSPYVRRQRDVWGEDDLELSLGRYSEVERATSNSGCRRQPSSRACFPPRRTREVARSLRRSWLCFRGGFRATRSSRRETFCVRKARA